MIHHPRIRIIVADNHPMIREGLSAVILHQRGMCIVGEASNGQEAIDLYRRQLPDVLLMDIAMPHMDGLQATQAILEEFPRARVIIFTILDGDETVYQAMLAGARAYLLKDSPVSLLLETIEAVVAGKTYLPAELAAKLAGRLHLRSLTKREQAVLEYIVTGKSNGEIGAMLFISEGTVKAHVNKILDKLGVHDRTQAAITALKRGLVHAT